MRREPLISLDGVGDEFLLTTDDLATIAQISTSLARDLLNTAKIPGAVRFGNRIRIAVKDVRTWIESEKLPKNRFVYDLRERMRELTHESRRKALR